MMKRGVESQDVVFSVTLVSRGTSLGQSNAERGSLFMFVLAG